jgi:hypothetical protein
MAQKVDVRFIDDLDGSDAVGTVKFSFQGLHDTKPKFYKIDLNADNGQAITESFADWIAAAQRDTDPEPAKRGHKSAGQSAVRTDREQAQAIREWARRQGHTVGDRGRVPKSILDAFNAAH